MQIKTTNSHLRYLVLGIWVSLIIVAFSKMITLGIPLSHYSSLIAENVLSFGLWAPIVFISLFAIRPILFFPATILSLSAGALFGPYKAIVILLVAENLSSFISYNLGKYFGKDIIKSLDKKNVFTKRFEKYLHDNEFISVLTLRLLYAPFDLVGYSSGASNITYKSFALATMIGIMPGLITAAFLGGSVYNPINLYISGLFFTLGLIISKLVKKQYTNKPTV